MPRIQEITLQPNLSAQSPQRQAVAADFDSGFGDSFGQIEALVTKLGQHYDETRRATTVNKALADAQSELLDYSFTLQNGSMDDQGVFTPPPDPGQYRPLFEAKTLEIQKKYGAGLDDLGLAMFDEKFGPVALRESFEVRKVAVDHQRAAISADLTQTLDTLAETYVSVGESVKPQVQTQALEAIMAAEQAGVISPEEGLKHRQQFVDTTMRAEMRKQIRDDPDAALLAMQSGELGVGMSPDEAQKWMDTAIAASERKIAAEAAQAAQRDRDAEKWRRESEEANSKAMWTLEAEGKLTPAMVIANADNLSGTEYKALLNEVTGAAPVTTDPVIYNDLRLRKIAGEDITADTSTAYTEGRINREAYDKLLGDADAPAWQKSGEKFISTALRPGVLNPAVGAPERLAGALDQWDQWAAEHPNATTAEARTEYKQIVEDYRIIDTKDILAASPAPRFLVGSRDVPDLGATVKETEKARDEGRITQSEFNRQMLLIEQWDGVMQSATPEHPER